MSGTTPTPAVHPANIAGSPGSTWAGAGVAIVGVVASMIQANGIPTTAAGWFMFLGSLATGIMAALGK